MLTVMSIPVEKEIDIVTARLRVSDLAEKLGFSASQVYAIAIAVSEVARNIVRYAGRGELIFTETHADGRHGLSIIARDSGPGIADLDLAMMPGYSTGSSLGLGLTIAQGQMDEFEIESAVGKGTTVTMSKWKRKK